MARTLILAEKPAVARDLARALGVSASGGGSGSFSSDRYVVTWCIGHLIELAEPAAYDAAYKRWSLGTLPILPGTFELRPIRGTQSQWQVVKQLLRSREFSSVINACDAGREGELIFRLCYELAGCKLPIQRLWISSLTAQAIEQGLANLRPGREYDALAAAARCRSEADWLVGMNATRAVTLWRRGGGGDALCSLGRVQTPTLGILVRREQQIQAFKPRDYFEVHAQLDTESGKPAQPFTAIWQIDKKRRIAEKAVAEQIRQRDAHAPAPFVERVETKNVREAPPLLFDLGSLQRTANRRFGWSAQRTLGIAQKLYEEHKLITYPRTDSRYLSTDLMAQMPKHFSALSEHSLYRPFVEPLLPPGGQLPRRIFQNHKVTDHHAIIPTTLALTAARVGALSREEQQLHDLVVRRFLGVFYPDAEFAQTRVVIRVDAPPGEPPPGPPTRQPDDEFVHAAPPPPDRFYAQGRVRLQAGWQAVAGLDESKAQRGAANSDGDSDGEADEESAGQALPPLAQGQRLRGSFQTLAKQTKPPPRYTDASLLAAMEGAGKQLDDEALRQAMKDAGLGTPATRAAILETLLDRGYAERRGKLLVPTAFGIDLIERLPAPSLASAELTGQWEARLARVAAAQEPRAAFMADIAAYVRDLVDKVKAAPAPAAVPPPPATSAPKTPGRRAAPGRKRTTTARKPAGRTRKAATGERPVRKRAAADSPAPKRPRAAAGKKPRATAAAKRTAVPRKPRSPKTTASGISTENLSANERLESRPVIAESKIAIPRRTASISPDSVPTDPTGARPTVGTPVNPGLRCPRCRAGWLIWGRRAWGCSNFRTCDYVVPFPAAGQELDLTQLRRQVQTDEGARR